QLVAREERLLQWRVPRQAEMLRMRQHGLDDLLRIALFAEDRRAVLRMLVERWVHLVVEVVQERRDPPELLVAVELAGICSRRGLDGKRVPEQRLALRVPRQRLPSLLASGRGHVATLPPYGSRSRSGRRVCDRRFTPAQRHDPGGREQKRRPS